MVRVMVRYRYSRDSTSGDIIVGTCIQFRPNVVLDHEKNIWADTIHILTHNVILHGPFNFESLLDNNRTRNKVSDKDWIALHKACKDLNILPPAIGLQRRFRSNTDAAPRQTNRNMKRIREDA